MNDLNKLIQNWQPEVTEPASFRRNVWRRIADEQARSKSAFTVWLEGIVMSVCRPKLAIVAATVAIGIGIGIGSLSAHSDSGATSYLRSVNPYAQVRL